MSQNPQTSAQIVTEAITKDNITEGVSLERVFQELESLTKTKAVLTKDAIIHKLKRNPVLYGALILIIFLLLINIFLTSRRRIVYKTREKDSQV
jgi:hypothetical protein